MQAQDIMNREVIKVTDKDSVRTVIEQFIRNRISGLPVVNDKDEILAFISDGDIMRYIGKHKDIILDSFYYVGVFKGDDEEFEDRVKRILDLNVLSVARGNVITVQWDEDVEHIAAVLGKKQIKKLPVERNGKLVGIISRGDVIRHSFQSLL